MATQEERNARQSRPVMDFARDIGDGQHVDQRNAEKPRVGPHPRRHVRHVKQGRHGRHRVADDEEDDGSC